MGIMADKTKISSRLIEEITDAIGRIEYGSVELIVQNKTVTQITIRNIKKTNVTVISSSEIKTKPKKETFRSARNNIYIGNKN